MAKYRCSVCGYIYDEEKEGRPFSRLKECPVCKQSPDKFVRVPDESDGDGVSLPASVQAEEKAEEKRAAAGETASEGAAADLRYDEAFARRGANCATRNHEAQVSQPGSHKHYCGVVGQ